MRVHVIQHVPFEGPAAIAEWAAERGHELTSALALTEEHPPADAIDFLAVMGGPMAADDDAGYPWLTAEKRFIAETIAAGRLVLGVCLGAQILAEAIGGTVRRNDLREIGWYPVEPTPDAPLDRIFSAWKGPVVVGQWHGDTFDLPEGLEPVLSSVACRNQAFVFDRRVVGLQFHLEWTPKSLADLMVACGSELGEGEPYVMSAAQLAEEAPARLPTCRERLFALLDAMAAEGPGVAGDDAP